MKSDAKKLQVEVVCLETNPHDAGNNVYLELSLPPPHPTTDGQGNPVSQAPPAFASLRMFVTSDARREAIVKRDDLTRARKRLRPELIADGDERAKCQAERDKLTGEIEKAVAAANKGGELAFKHGVKYLMTIEEAK